MSLLEDMKKLWDSRNNPTCECGQAINGEFLYNCTYFNSDGSKIYFECTCGRISQVYYKHVETNILEGEATPHVGRRPKGFKAKEVAK